MLKRTPLLFESDASFRAAEREHRRWGTPETAARLDHERRRMGYDEEGIRQDHENEFFRQFDARWRADADAEADKLGLNQTERRRAHAAHEFAAYNRDHPDAVEWKAMPPHKRLLYHYKVDLSEPMARSSRVTPSTRERKQITPRVVHPDKRDPESRTGGKRAFRFETDTQLRDLHRTALLHGDPVSRAAHARGLLRAGRPHEEIDQALGDDNPHRQELAHNARSAGHHDLADHLELAPLARQWQRAESTGATDAERSARSTLWKATLRAYDARPRDERPTDMYWPTRFFSKEHAPDPRNTPPGSGLRNQIAKYRGIEGSDGENYTVTGWHPGSAKHWRSPELDAFKNDLDHHKLGKISHHNVGTSIINTEPDDYHDPWDHDHYTVTANHHLKVDPTSTADTHAEPERDARYTPHAVVGRDERHIAWTAHQRETGSAR